MARKRSSQQKALLQGRLAETAPGPSSAHCPSARSRMASQQQHALGTIEGGISIDTHVRRKHQANTSVRRIHISRNQAPAPPQPTRTQPTRMARQLATTYSIATPQAPSGACVCIHTSCCITVSTCITCPNSARQCSNSPPQLEPVRHPQQLLHEALQRLLFPFLFLFHIGLPVPLAARALFAPFVLFALAACFSDPSPTHRLTRPSVSAPAPAPAPPQTPPSHAGNSPV